jgi:hypothetical protein
LGPTMTVTPGSHSIRVRSANDLNPAMDSVFRCTEVPRLAGNDKHVV